MFLHIVGQEDWKTNVNALHRFDIVGKTSFRSDYGIKLDEEDLHWWEFMELMNGLSNSEMGNCCVLNRVRNLRNFNINEITDSKERAKINR